MSNKSKRVAAFLLALLMTVSSVLVEVPTNVSAAQSGTKTGFVYADGTKFKIDGSDFYYAGTNNYYINFKPSEDVDEVMKDAESMGLTVIRTWGNIEVGTMTDEVDEDGYPVFEGNADTDNAVGHKEGVYYQYFDKAQNKPVVNEGEYGLEKLDYAIAAAKEHNIKLLITFTNYWYQFGGMDQYLKWAGLMSGDGNRDAFYTNETVKGYFKNYINTMLNHTNKYTGVKYKDEPAIFAWELSNEPRCNVQKKGKDENNIYKWATEMSAYVKSIDPNHMVAVGDEGGLNYADESEAKAAGFSKMDWMTTGGSMGDFEALMDIPTVDFGTPHVYVSDWGLSKTDTLNWIKVHADIAHKADKPVILEELGWKPGDASAFATRDEYYREVYKVIEDNDYAGSNFWMIASHTVNDAAGYYPDYDGYTVYGFAGMATDSARNLIMEHAAKMNAKGERNKVSAASASFDKAKGGAVEVTVTPQSGSSISGVTVDGKALSGSDCTISGNKVTFTDTYLKSLEEGRYSAVITMTAGMDLAVTLIVEDSSVVSAKADKTSYVFDKNTKVSRDVEILVTVNDGGALKGVNLIGRGNQKTAIDAANYTFADGKLTLKADYLKTLDASAVTVQLDFTRGTDPEVKITLADSTGKDAIDGFESANSLDAWTVNPNGDKPTLSIVEGQSDSKALSFAYDISGQGYAGITKSASNLAITGFGGISFWIKTGENTDKKNITIQLREPVDENSGIYWEKTLTWKELDAAEGKDVTVLFKDFKPKPSDYDGIAQPAAGQLCGQKGVNEFSLYVGGEDKTGTFYIDNIVLGEPGEAVGPVDPTPGPGDETPDVLGEKAWTANFDPSNTWDEIKDGDNTKEYTKEVTGSAPKVGDKITATVYLPTATAPSFAGEMKFCGVIRLGSDWHWVESLEIPALSAKDFKKVAGKNCYSAAIEIPFGETVKAYYGSFSGDDYKFSEVVTENLAALTLKCAGSSCDYKGDICIGDLKIGKNGGTVTPDPDDPTPGPVEKHVIDDFATDKIKPASGYLWYANPGYQYNHGAKSGNGEAEPEVSYNSSKQNMQIKLDYSADADKSWSEAKIALWSQQGYDISQYNCLSLEYTYPTALKDVEIKVYATNPAVSEAEKQVIMDSNMEKANEKDNGDGTSTATMILYFTPTSAVKLGSINIGFVGKNTNSTGTVYIDNVELSKRTIPGATEVEKPGTGSKANLTKMPETVTMVDKAATSETKAVFAFLNGMSAAGQVVFGHQNDNSRRVAGEESDTKDLTGSLSGLVAYDSLALTGSELGMTTQEGLSSTIASAKAAAAQGAIISLSLHMPNFATMGKDGSGDFSKYDFESSKDLSGNCAENILPGKAYNSLYTSYLDVIVDFAKSLQNDGIPVILRPLHENNGGWFWWGSSTKPEVYKALYRYTVNYFKDNGVHNFIYEYSPNGPITSEEYFLSRYPGDEYVDILAFDYYSDYSSKDAAYDESFMRALRESCEVIKKLAADRNKVAAIAETGVRVTKANGDNNGLLVSDNPIKGHDWYNAVNTVARQTGMSYFLLWANFSNQNFYVPYKFDATTGHELSNDFIKFYNDETSVFANDIDIAAVKAKGSSITVESYDTVSGFMVDPTDFAEIPGPTSFTAQVVNADGDVVFKISVDGKDAVEVKAAANGSTYTATLTADIMAGIGATDTATVSLVAGGKTLAQAKYVSFNKKKPVMPEQYLDNFEYYFGDADYLSSKYSGSNSAAGCTSGMSITPRNRKDGEYAGRFDYTLSYSGAEVYTGTGMQLTNTAFAGKDAFSFWIVPDGYGQKLVVQVVSAGKEFEADLTEFMKGTEGQYVTIPFDRLKPKVSGAQFDASAVTQLYFYCNSVPENAPADVKDANGNYTIESSIWVDCMKAITMKDDLKADADFTNGYAVTDQPLDGVADERVEKDEYTVTFDSNGGTAVASQTVAAGAKVTEPNPPVKAGYEFLGWYLGNVKYDFTQEVQADLTITAHWQASDAKYVVKYYHQNTDRTDYVLSEADTKEAEAEVGTKVTAAPLVLPGFTLNSAKSKASGEVLADGSLVLELYYDRNVYTITYETDGGTQPAKDKTEYVYGVGLQPLGTTAKDGYAFEGWYDEDDNIVTRVTNTQTGNIVLHAKWQQLSEGEAAYTVFYYEQNRAQDDYNRADRQTIVGKVGDTVTAEAPDRPGFTYDEEKSRETASGTIAEDGSLELYLYYTRNVYPIHYVLDGGVNNADNPDTYLYEVMTMLQDATKEGYIFNGWFEDEAHTKRIRSVNTGTIGEVTVYASWTKAGDPSAKTHRITYIVNGGTRPDTLPSYYEEGVGAVLGDPVYDDHEFLGWYTTSDFEEGTRITEIPKDATTDYTLYAKWNLDEETQKRIHNITYVLYGDETVPGTFEEEKEMRLMIPSRDGWRFDGWYTTPEFTLGTGLTRVPLTQVTDLVVYAKWTKLEVNYTVTFNSNGGTAVAAQTVEAGAKASQPAAPTRNGFVFKGWYLEGRAYDFAAAVNGNITLVAQWEAVKASPVKVTGITISGISKKIAAGKKIQLTAAVAPVNATDSSVTWTIKADKNAKYAAVDAKTGLVTTKKAGKNKTVTVIATANDGSGKTAEYKIKLMQKAVKKIVLKASATKVKAGKKVKIKATVTPKASTKKINKTLKWESSNTKYATVTKKGVVKTKKAGKGKTVKITARATDGSNKKKTIKIKITK